VNCPDFNYSHLAHFSSQSTQGRIVLDQGFLGKHQQPITDVRKRMGELKCCLLNLSLLLLVSLLHGTQPDRRVSAHISLIEKIGQFTSSS
jgi:hypothetical protein